ncbi:MAG TPA: O-methyltransferase [Nevskiaceae bacterium]|nr:O-methyltransferase [Nevskiaceae bacterium]
MSEQLWDEVDDYINGLLAPADEALDGALEAADAAGLPQIAVAPNQGKLLHLLAQTVGASAILEIGTLAGYSTIWLARALKPGGRVVTLESDIKHAEVANANLARAGLAGMVEIRVGRALDTLPQIAAQNRGPFDFIFIDADKASIPEYFKWALKLSRRGSLIVIDNVVRKGAILDAASEDSAVRGVRRMYELIAAEPRVSATAIQTVGGKGHDGFCLVRVLSG